MPAYCEAGGDWRFSDALESEARRRLADTRAHGFDLAGASDQAATSRVDAIYANARAALMAPISADVLAKAVPRALTGANGLGGPRRLSVASGDRRAAEGHQAPAGWRRCMRVARRRCRSSSPLGLNALAVNEQLRVLLPSLRRRFAESGIAIRATDIVVRNGRVRVGYQIGGLVKAAVIVHLLGERPGTGLNSLSAYVTLRARQRRTIAMEQQPRSFGYQRGVWHSSTRKNA